MGFRFGKRTFLVTWHPQVGEDVSELISALEESEAEVIWTYPNADPGYQEIIEKIKQTKFQLYTNLGQKRYFSLAKQCTAVVGNSSSGIIEAPSLGVPVLNIGKRQDGRPMAAMLCTCECKKEMIYAHLITSNLEYFKTSDNPYYQPGTCQRIADEIMKRYG
jgi:UDP-N-acetylglucosamine 2-epimerase